MSWLSRHGAPLVSLLFFVNANLLARGADQAELRCERTDEALLLRYRLPEVGTPGKTIFIALGDASPGGSAILPFGEKVEGSTVFLPFRAQRFFALRPDSKTQRLWDAWQWSSPAALPASIAVQFEKDEVTLTLPRALFSDAPRLQLVAYAKDFREKPWGWLLGASDPAVESGAGDKYFPHFLELDLTAADEATLARRDRLASTGDRLRIYQLFVRLFGNSNETRKPNGTLQENGVGKFSDLNDAALTSLRAMGFSHLWLTGVLQQATGTDYSAIGQPADDPDLLKGVAGSPYAIKDYFDVSPDYADKPRERIAEFQALLQRMHSHGLKALIDFVPNHVARSYASDIKPQLDFGRSDDKSKFFAPNNNFFYLKNDANGPPLRLPTLRDGKPVSPTCQLAGMECDGLFPPEKEFGRVTGNNKVSWRPDLGDWYETIKLNYGYDFTGGSSAAREYPYAGAADKAIPDTWQKMDEVLAYWQSLGVDGFRCDMSHMEPPEFWHWAIARARARNPEVVFVGEAYDNDPAKVPGSDPVVSKLNGGKSNVMFDLLNAGFNAVYDDPSYKALKNIYDGNGWANDLDQSRSDPFIFDNSLRYAENHDEVRLAAASQWGKLGPQVGRPVSALLYGIGRGAVMLYNGQEVGEPGTGAEGFGGDDARTSIFDYWSMPELVKWTNQRKYDGAGLSAEQQTLRDFYARLLRLMNEPAFRDGNFFPLNPANNQNPKFGRTEGESASGHWLYAFLRYDPLTQQRFLAVINLHPRQEARGVEVILPAEALRFFALAPKAQLHLEERLEGNLEINLRLADSDSGRSEKIVLPPLPPLTPCFFEIATR